MLNPILIALIILGVVLQGVFIAVEHKEKYVGAVILKGLGSMLLELLLHKRFLLDLFWECSVIFV